jgi:serine/threonine protein kinase
VTDFLLAGRYQLTDRIAAGGMGEVWRALDQLLNRRVAVKLLPTVRAGDESSLARFRAEARYAASLSHPGIARVYDYGESTEYGGAYLVMELVDGDPLSAILARNGRLSPDATLDIVGQAALALDAAHQAGIVHRDIKPGNILIAPGGTAKITDFGIATAVRASQTSHLTQTGMVMGTAMYVSPEQATGAVVTASSDIYSLGVVAFECLGGRPPFTAREPLAIAYAHKHEPVPPLPPDVPPLVLELVHAMLAKTPDQRPSSARVVADRANVLREAIMLGRSDPAATAGHLPRGEETRLDMPRPELGAGLAGGGLAGGGLTRADLPAASTAPSRLEGPYLPERTRRASSRRRPGSGRPLLTAALTVLICALAAGVSFYLSGHLLNKSSNAPRGTSVDDVNTPTSGGPGARPTGTACSGTPAAAAMCSSPSSLGLSTPSPHHTKVAPTQSANPASPTPAALSSSPSPTASPASSPTQSPTPTSSPTQSPTSSPTPTATIAPTTGTTPTS